MKKLLLPFLFALFSSFGFGAAANDITLQQVNAGGTGFTQRTFSGDSAISTTTASFRSSIGLGIEDSPNFTAVSIGVTTPGIIGGTSGSLTLTGAGSNQSITLTPSGTGKVNDQFATSKIVAGEYSSDGYSRLAFLPTATAATAANSLISSNGSQAFYNIPTSGAHTFQVNSSSVLALAASSATFTTSGSDTLVLSGGANAALTGGAGNMTITSGTGNSRTLVLQTTTSGGAATNALSLSATQDATIGGDLTISGGDMAMTGAATITGGAGNMTVTAGTGASRDLTFRSTTSGSTATTFLRGDSNQDVYAANGGLLISGAIASNVASTAILDYSSGARLISQGTDASTNGLISLISQRSDGSNSLTAISTSLTGTVAVNGATASTTTALITPASATGVSSLRIPHGTAPSSPVNGDLWTTTGGLFLRTNGATVGPFGTGNGNGTVAVVSSGSLTSTALVTGGGTTTLQTPSATATLDTSGNLSTPGSGTFGAGGSVAGSVAFGQGTTQSTGTTNIIIQAPTSVTSYIRTLPGAVGSSGFLLETVSGSVQTESLVAFSGTGSVARVDSPTFTTAITVPALTGTTGVFASTTSLLVGTAGSAVGNVGFRNATSGTATLAPPTGALGTYTVTLPNAASTLPIYGQQITYAGPTAARTVTYPDAAFTVAGLATAQTFTASNTQINFTADAQSDDTYTGATLFFGKNAGATIAQWELVYLNTSGVWVLCDADAGTPLGPGSVFGLAITSGTNGNPLTVLGRGFIRNDGWAWGTVSGSLYASGTAGGMTQTAPSTATNGIMLLGNAITDDEIWFAPSWEWSIKQ